MTQLDEILSQHEHDGCPTSRAFRRELVIELRRVLLVRRGVTLRLRPDRLGRRT